MGQSNKIKSYYTWSSIEWKEKVRKSIIIKLLLWTPASSINELQRSNHFPWWKCTFSNRCGCSIVYPSIEHISIDIEHGQLFHDCGLLRMYSSLVNLITAAGNNDWFFIRINSKWWIFVWLCVSVFVFVFCVAISLLIFCFCFCLVASHSYVQTKFVPSYFKIFSMDFDQIKIHFNS